MQIGHQVRKWPQKHQNMNNILEVRAENVFLTKFAIKYKLTMSWHWLVQNKYFIVLLFFVLFLSLAIDFAISKDAVVLPKQVKYSLRLPHEVGGIQKRWRTENTYPNFQAVGPRKDEDGFVSNAVIVCIVGTST